MFGEHRKIIWRYYTPHLRWIAIPPAFVISKRGACLDISQHVKRRSESPKVKLDEDEEIGITPI